jgi:hypothetical protein
MLHRYYATALRRAFFAGDDGADVPLPRALRGARKALARARRRAARDGDGALADDRGVAEDDGSTPPRPLAPNVILGCTVNDYLRPSDAAAAEGVAVPLATRAAAPLELTPRVTGGRRTGWTRVTPRAVTLARGMAISGAAIDGLFLASFARKSVRFWLQVGRVLFFPRLPSG